MCAALMPDRFALDGAAATRCRRRRRGRNGLLDVADSCPAMAITVTDGGREIGPRP